MRSHTLSFLPYFDLPFVSQSAGQFNDRYTEVIDASIKFSFTPVATLTYDAVWALALALNKTEEMMDTLNETEILERTGCDDTTGALVPLTEFEYSNALMGCVIRWNIQETKFLGVSVGNSAIYIHCTQCSFPGEISSVVYNFGFGPPY